MKKHLISIALASALVSSSVHAEIYLSGFASIVGGVTSSSDELLYNYDDNFDLKLGSLVALQASSDLDNGLGVTVQLTAKGKDDWDPEFKWAYVSYDASDNFRVLAGRQRIPLYMYSDFLDVSYAYAWIDPPKGVYDVIFDTFDGLGAVYTTNFGNVDASFHGVYGRNTDDIEAFGEIFSPQFNDLAGLATTFTYDWLTLRAGYFVADVIMPITSIDGLAAGWQQAGFDDIANNTRIDEDSGTFLELGFQINLNEIIVVAEYTELEVENTPLGDEESYYVMAGYQFDQVLVHVTVGADESTNNIYTTNIPYGLDPSLDFLKANTEGLIDDRKEKQNYVSVGVRYEFHDSAALKLEYTDFSDDIDSNSDAGLFRVALVTVF
jgi:predicted porin